ncbi:MAG: hypothetical protein ACYTG0_22770, partial [Planctomycetota bacterium]
MSLSNLLIGSDYGAGQRDIFGEFIDPTTGNPTTDSFVGFWALSGPGSDNLSDQVSLTVFGRDGQVLGQSFPSPDVQFDYLSVSVPGIASFRFDARPGLEVMDDFS